MQFSFTLTLVIAMTIGSLVSAQTETPTPKEVIIDGVIQRPPPPPRDKVAAALKKFREACLEARQDFLLKYPNVKEDPKKTCKCMEDGLAFKDILSFMNDGYAYYGKDLASIRQRRKSEDMGLDMIYHVERNCLADPTWKIETDPPKNLDARMKEIEAQKKMGR